MKTRTILLSAAALAALNLSAASFLYAQQDPAKTSPDTSGNTNPGAAAASDQNQSSTGSQGYRSSRAGMSGMSDVAQSDRDQIDRTLAQCVKAAVQPGKFNDLVNCLCRQDRDRIQAQKPDTAQLDQSARALGDSWKTKFGQDFDISDEKQAFTPFMIMSGESAEARTAGATMGPGASAGSTYGGTSGSSGASTGISGGTSGGTGASAGIAGGTSSSGTGTGASAGISGGSSGSGSSGTASVTGDTTGTGASSSSNQPGQAQQASAQEGQRAHIMVPASHGLPEVTVNLVKEGGDWKIDIPDSIDANQLSQNLQSQLSQAQTNQSRWPSDQGRAQAALAHHVLLALEGRTSSAMGTGAGTGSNSNYGTGAGTGTGSSGSNSGTGTDTGSTGTGR